MQISFLSACSTHLVLVLQLPFSTLIDCIHTFKLHDMFRMPAWRRAAPLMITGAVDVTDLPEAKSKV